MTDHLSDVAATALSLLQSAHNGDAAAADQLGDLMPSLTAAAESGDTGAQNVLGGILLEHIGDPSGAAFWFGKAGRSGAGGKADAGQHGKRSRTLSSP
ncbi:hypothetical protein ACH5A3_20580 [Streptomyces echinatus]|uniref:hypothetical protein n=1 Tax=Streptomyces echinatus TaxID=67293 RepID=UPI0037AC9137